MRCATKENRPGIKLIRLIGGLFLALTLLLTALVPTGTVLADDPPNPYEKLPNPATLPAGAGRGVAFSHDSTYMAVGHDNSPFVTIYKRDGDTFAKLANPATLPPWGGQGVAFSHDSTYMAVPNISTAPYITIYERDGDTFTKLDDPATPPTGWAYDVAFSHDSTYMAVAHESSPYVTIYKRDGDTFTKLDNPAALPTGGGTGVAFSHDSTYMAVAHIDSPYVTIYKRDGDTFTKLANPATLPAGNAMSVAFSHDSTYMTVCHLTSPYITIYKRDGDTFTKLDNPATLPTGNGRGVAFSHDSAYMAVTHDSSPYITIYERSGDTFTKLANPATLPVGNAMSVAFSHNSRYLAAGHFYSPFVTIYKYIPPPPTVVSAETSVDGAVITIEFNKAMADPAGKHAQFNYQINGGADQGFSAAALDGNTTKINLTTSGTAIAHGDIVTVSYTAGDVEAEDGGVLASFSDQAVTNNMPVPPGSIIGTFDLNQPPVVDSVSLTETSLTPQVEYTVTVTVSDADTLDDLSAVVLKLWYDADGGTPLEEEFDAATGNAQNAAVITWTNGSGFALSAGDPTTWSLGDCAAPADLGETSGNFTYVFTVGKVATEASGSAKWQVGAKATDSASQTDFNYDAEGAAMEWYGEITVPDDITVDWGTLAAGVDFENTRKAIGAAINYISNGDFDKQVRSAASWSGSTYTAILDPSGATASAQQFALKADDTDGYATAVLVGTSPVTIGTGTQTAESGSDVTTMNLWIRLASSFQFDIYSGAITYSIVN